MKYRPDIALHFLRNGLRFPPPLENEAPPCPPPPPPPSLPWLRTMVLDCKWSALEDMLTDKLQWMQSASSTVQSDKTEKDTEEASGGRDVAVESVVLLNAQHVLNDDSSLSPSLSSTTSSPSLSLLLLLQRWIQRISILTALDLRGTTHELASDALLFAVATTHHSTLRRLLLPRQSCVSQTTLNLLTTLEELDITAYQAKGFHVHFCGATLRRLSANGSTLSDAGLSNATALEVLHVSRCGLVTTVAPFARSLRELDVSFGCRIGSDALSQCNSLQVLNADGARSICSIEPFASSLRELFLGTFFSQLGDEEIASATNLVKLVVSETHHVTTVAPFAASLRELDAQQSGIHQTEGRGAGLEDAVQLVRLASNRDIRDFRRFPQLLELDAIGLDDRAVASIVSPSLISLHLRPHQEMLTTLAPVARTLRHLVVHGDPTYNNNSSLADDGVLTVTNLVTLDCSGYGNLTTLAPFATSLEQLRCEGYGCKLKGEAVRELFDRIATSKSTVPLMVVNVGSVLLDSALVKPKQHLVPFGFEKRLEGEWVRRKRSFKSKQDQPANNNKKSDACTLM